MSDDLTPEQVREILESERLDMKDFLDPKPFPLDWLESDFFRGH
jgi:hypothetical protein